MDYGLVMTIIEALQALSAAPTDPTLSDALRARGYTHHRYSESSYRHYVQRDGRTVAILDADAGWRWLARRDQKLRALGRR